MRRSFRFARGVKQEIAYTFEETLADVKAPILEKDLREELLKVLALCIEFFEKQTSVLTYLVHFSS